MPFLKHFILFSFLIFLSLNTNGQKVDMAAFEAKSDSIENLTLVELREQQMGIQINFNYSFHPAAYEIRVNYLKESLLPIGVYAGFGITKLFTNTIKGDEVDLNYPVRNVLNDADEWTWFDDGKKQSVRFASSPYFVLGLSKNISAAVTIYGGYAIILNSHLRSEWLQDTEFEENTMLDFGCIFRTRLISLSLGVMMHLPYYDMESEFGEEFGIGIRTQIGIGYIL